VDQIVDLRLTLRYLGVPICEKSYLFGDNKSVVDSSAKPHSKLHKQHNALSFHRVCEAVTSRYVSFTFIDGEYNPADILSKHWGYQQVEDPHAHTILWRKYCGLLRGPLSLRHIGAISLEGYIVTCLYIYSYIKL